ncbi:MAG: RNA polymerase subunit sigma-24, partial [Oscillospiraceae bacterium]|nr:RNA polymerase subunit sigma-24 [Oscillospiraceae bacterium]
DIEKQYLKEEQRIELHRAMKRLKTEYAQVLYLMYFEDFDTAEIAGIMKKSKKQIGDLLYRAKKALKSELEKEGFVYEEL